MKRISVFLLAIMMAFCLSACGTDGEPSSQAGDSGNVVSTQENRTDNKTADADAPDGLCGYPAARSKWEVRIRKIGVRKMKQHTQLQLVIFTWVFMK